MGVGGLARFFAEARDEADVLAACAWARSRRAPLYVLGGGSNLVVDDAGVDGLVLKIALRGVKTRGGRRRRGDGRGGRAVGRPRAPAWSAAGRGSSA